MLAVLQLIGAFVADLFKSRPAMLCDYFKPRRQLEAEILVLRHQLSVLQQRAPRRRLHFCVGPIVLCSFGSIVATLVSLTP
jgi:hypothetical protein